LLPGVDILINFQNVEDKEYDGSNKEEDLEEVDHTKCFGWTEITALTRKTMIFDVVASSKYRSGGWSGRAA